MSIQTEVEKVFEELKAELLKLFGDNSGVHNTVNDAHSKVQEAIVSNTPEPEAEKPEEDKSSTTQDNPPV